MEILGGNAASDEYHIPRHAHNLHVVHTCACPVACLQFLPVLTAPLPCHQTRARTTFTGLVSLTEEPTISHTLTGGPLRSPREGYHRRAGILLSDMRVCLSLRARRTSSSHCTMESCLCAICPFEWSFALRWVLRRRIDPFQLHSSNLLLSRLSRETRGHCVRPLSPSHVQPSHSRAPRAKDPAHPGSGRGANVQSATSSFHVPRPLLLTMLSSLLLFHTAAVSQSPQI